MTPEKLADMIQYLVDNAGDLPSLPDITDADMALMYLRHLERHLYPKCRHGVILDTPCPECEESR